MNLDDIIFQIGGFGAYQIRRYLLLCLLLVFATFPTLSYIFTTRNAHYRCFIKECENQDSSFSPNWLRYAVPFERDEPNKCLRFINRPQNTSDFTIFTGQADVPENETCDVTAFDTTQTARCHEFIFQNTEGSSIAEEFNILCDENLWKLTIIGTINNLGFTLGLPLSGYISDKYGRRTLMIVSVLASTVFGTLKSFSPNYISFVILEFIDMTLGAGTYSAAYILGMEMLTAKNRVVGSTVLSCAFALGEATMGLVAWYTPSWRIFLRTIYIPGLLFISYFWLMDESVRWLASKNKHDRFRAALAKIAKENGDKLDDSSIKQLNVAEDEARFETVDRFLDVFKNPRILLRMVNCSICWICCIFVYYGLTLQSVGISGNLFINFIAASLIEIPAYVAANFSLSRIGRRYSLSFSFIFSGLACLVFVFTPHSENLIRLAAFLFGKFAITISYASIYLYTTEMFPTSLRHSFMSTCSMFGRFGSMVAPQVPLLARIADTLPIIIFGVSGVLAGILSLLFPETLNIKLPDTIEEAKVLGRKDIPKEM